MLKCAYCGRKYVGTLMEAQGAGWGYLQFKVPGRLHTIFHCPAHKDQAFEDMLTFTHKVLTSSDGERRQDDKTSA